MCFVGCFAVAVFNNFVCRCFYVCPERDVPPPAARPPLHVLPRAARLVLLRGPGAVGVRVAGAIETDAVPDPAHAPATAHTLGRGNAEDEEAALGDAMREHALAP